MTFASVAGAPGLSPRDASAAMALVTATTEPAYEVVGFFTGAGGMEVERGTDSETWAGDVHPAEALRC